MADISVQISIPQYTATAVINSLAVTATLNFTANISNMRIRIYNSSTVQIAPSVPGGDFIYEFTAFKNFQLTKMVIITGTATILTSIGDDPMISEWDSANGKLRLAKGQPLPPNTQITVMGNLK